MTEESQRAELVEIASSSAPLPERAQAVLERLSRWLPIEASWIALSDPESTVYCTVGSAGLDQTVLDLLERPVLATAMRRVTRDQDRPPVSMAELPRPLHKLPTWAVRLCEPGGHHLGVLGLVFASGRIPSAATQDRIERLAPLIALGMSPGRSLLATARLVPGAGAGVVLYRDGPPYRLSGLEDHPVLAADSPVVSIAHRALGVGQVYRSFMWPVPDDPGGGEHVGVTVLAATDVPAFVLGIVVVTSGADSRGLTPRELEVLGLIVDGRSNQQIARRLVVAPRTVASHVEHILHKLQAPSRTSAAVIAEREGCHVPPRPTRQ